MPLLLLPCGGVILIRVRLCRVGQYPAVGLLDVANVSQVDKEVAPSETYAARASVALRLVYVKGLLDRICRLSITGTDVQRLEDAQLTTDTERIRRLQHIVLHQGVHIIVRIDSHIVRIIRCREFAPLIISMLKINRQHSDTPKDSGHTDDESARGAILILVFILVGAKRGLVERRVCHLSPEDRKSVV